MAVSTGLAAALRMSRRRSCAFITGIRITRPRRRGVSNGAQVVRLCLISPVTQKFIACNADEGDSGTFLPIAWIMEGDPSAASKA
jgi:NADH:ubiquinone oxidoreductase subunit F (NADH-binding)